MEEIFKPVPSFPDYLVSQFGRVKTRSRKIRFVHAVTGKECFRQSEEKFLKVQFNRRTGYKLYQLYKNQKMYNKNVHLLVAEAFLERPDGLTVINHKDGNKHNNTIENLEWCSNEYNHEHAIKTGLKASGSRIGTSVLNERCVIAIRNLLKKGLTHREIAEIFEVTRPTISLIAEKKTWKNFNP